MKILHLLAVFLTFTVAALASSSPPAPPSGGGSGSNAPSSREKDAPELSFYNDGVKLLFQKKWAEAQKQFEAAVAINEKMAEGHNNLAYVLRKQGAQNFEKSLAHYNRALELKPKMAEAYMYRGVLHLFMGHPDLAKADHETLVKMRSKLAPHLQKVIDTGKEEEPEQFYGVNKKK